MTTALDPSQTNESDLHWILGIKHALTAQAEAAKIWPGASLMMGGFMGVGSPHRLIDAIVPLGAIS
jgi:hypothetical protein